MYGLVLNSASFVGADFHVTLPVPCKGIELWLPRAGTARRVLREGSPLRWDYLFRVHHQKPRSFRKFAMTNKRVVIAIGAQRREAISGGNMRSLRKLAMTNKRVVIAIGAQRREAISGGNMKSRRKLAVTNFVFFASFVVQNTVNRRID